ncbi:MAG: LysR family transcriptional regulator [Bacilli bacterium]
MNTEYLLYALEVAKTGSINKAAENLFVSQPNLSRDLKKLEADVGITIFTRTSKGIEITADGSTFLEHARTIIDELDKLNPSKNSSNQIQQEFSLACPKANYISHAFTNFVQKLNKNKSLAIDYKETNSIGAINEIFARNFHLGIVRFSKNLASYFQIYLKETGLKSIPICEFDYNVAFSKNSVLAKKKELTVDDFSGMIELSHGDPFIPNITAKLTDTDAVITDKRIHVYDSMGQLAMINMFTNSFMVVYPLDKVTLAKYNLMQAKIPGISQTCCDSIIYRTNYKLTFLDEIFIKELKKSLNNPKQI